MTRPLLLLALSACSSQESPVTVNIDNYNTVESSCCSGCGSCCDGDSGDTSDTGTVVETCECPDGYTAAPAGDACVRETTVAATLNGGTPYNVAAADDNSAYGKFGGVLPDGTTFPNAPWTTRLNDIGIWAAQDYVITNPTGNTDPVGEEIGFAVCIDIQTAGDYLVGLAGDNRITLKVDGVVEFYMDETMDPLSWNDDGRAPFEGWWLLPVPLPSGKHIVELYGYNTGSVAAFGGEIYGPFADNSLDTVSGQSLAVDEAAADSSLTYFSTGAETIFDLGQDHGYSCPDGYALDLCSDEVTCSLIESIPCE